MATALDAIKKGGIAGVRLERHYNTSAPKGVNGRNSDNTFIKQVLGWEPNTSLRTGMSSRHRGQLPAAPA